ncbi:MAG TPA: transposase [Bacillota bacterium]
MDIIIIILSISVPIVMYYFQKRKPFRVLFNVLAIISFIIFGNISAIAIYYMLIDNAVFTTTIHGIFLNPFFLITGAYIGVYLIYRLFLLTVTER